MDDSQPVVDFGRLIRGHGVVLRARVIAVLLRRWPRRNRPSLIDSTVKVLIPYAPAAPRTSLPAPFRPSCRGARATVRRRHRLVLPAISPSRLREAAADGYTLLVGNVSTNAINESTFADVMQIRPSRDLVGFRNWSRFHMWSWRLRRFAQFGRRDDRWAKRNPGKLNYASAASARILSSIC